MEIDRQEIVDQLRGRNEDEVADRAERELPEQVDTDEHAALLHQRRAGMPSTCPRSWSAGRRSSRRA